jgi:hypothetical protein
MPRSERCRIRANCLQGIAAPFPCASSCRRRKRLSLDERPGVGRLVGPSGRLKGLESFRRPGAGGWRTVKAVSEALRTVARARASDKQRPSWKTIGAGPAARLGAGAARAGRDSQAGLMEAAGLGLAGLGAIRWSLERAKARSGALKCCALDNFVSKGFHPIASP